MTVIIIVAVGFILTILLSLYITVMITKLLNKAVFMINELSQGHLEYRVDIKSGDEIGKMVAAMNQFAKKLQEDFAGIL
jgi:methyl-accepting chemotaxis protein